MNTDQAYQDGYDSWERGFVLALVHLAAARDLLKVSAAPKALAKVRAAISSTQNAQRKQ